MDWAEIESAVAPHANAVWEQSMRTSLLLFAFLGCTLIFAYVFLRNFKVRSPFRWIVALAAFSGFVLIRAGGLRKPEVSVLIGVVQKLEQEEISLQWNVTITEPREFVLQEGLAPVARRRDTRIVLPCLPALAAHLKPGSEETLILLRNFAVGLRTTGRTKIFLPTASALEK